MGGIRIRALIWALALMALMPRSAMAQRSIVEGHAGRAWFLDEAPIEHAVATASVRFFVGSRVAIGPEVAYMRGPGEDRDWFLTGNATVDVGPLRWRARAMPYAVVGAGMSRFSTVIGAEPFSSSEGAFTFGAGARIALGTRWFVAPEYRIGWEPHWRLGVSVGWIR